ncbi:MAG: VCBS repeat-containing protein [Phycisphaeraceae bacterium]|nr:VCBS repeat-containing protein [Phycisphaeraceae bacterium]
MATLLAAMLCVLAVPDKASGQTEPVPLFKPAEAYSLGLSASFPYGLAAADIVDANGDPGQDGYPEVAVVSAGWPMFGCEGVFNGSTVTVFRNMGTWATDPTTSLVVHWQAMVPDGPASEVAFADVTGTNGPDLIVLGWTTDHFHGVLYVFPSLGNGLFDDEPMRWIAPGHPLRGLAVADLDNDGDLDVVAAVHCPGNGPRNFVHVFKNRLVQTNEFDFDRHPIMLDIDGFTAAGDVAIGDFFSLSPGQPLVDFVTPNPYADSISVVRNLSGLQFDPVTTEPPSPCGSQTWLYETIVSGRFGADAHWDFAAVETGQPFVGVFLGNGLGSFQSSCDNSVLRQQLYSGTANVRAHGIAAGHFNGGTKLDLVIALSNLDGPTGGGEPWAGGIAVLLGRSDGTFQAPSSSQAYLYTSGSVDHAIMAITADLNNDGYDDVIVSNHNTDSISVFINRMVTVVGP